MSGLTLRRASLVKKESGTTPKAQYIDGVPPESARPEEADMSCNGELEA